MHYQRTGCKSRLVVSCNLLACAGDAGVVLEQLSGKQRIIHTNTCHYDVRCCERSLYRFSMYLWVDDSYGRMVGRSDKLGVQFLC